MHHLVPARPGQVVTGDHGLSFGGDKQELQQGEVEARQGEVFDPYASPTAAEQAFEGHPESSLNVAGRSDRR